MGTNVNSVCQSADNENLGTIFPQVCHETMYKVLPISRAMACAHNADNTPCIDIGRPLVIQHNRCIVTFLQPLWIAVRAQRQRRYAMLLHKRCFIASSAQCPVPVFQSIYKTRRAVGQHVANVVAVFVNSPCTAQLTVQCKRSTEMEVADARKRHGIYYLLLHILFYKSIKNQRHKPHSFLLVLHIH